MREIDDKHLLQQIKKADVFHSETPSDFERVQMVGLTSVPLKQFEDDSQKQQQQQSSDDGGTGADSEGSWNHNQPKGKSAEAVMLYMNGHRSHPVAIVDDRRVRPYAMKEGETAVYHASGTEMKTFFNDTGAFLLANNNATEEKDAKEKERYASLRHVKLKKQKHEIKENDKVEEHKHEGDEVNLEVRTTSNRIEFRAGEKVVGYYDKKEDTWYFTGKLIHNDATETMKDTAKVIDRTASESIKDTALRIDHN